MNESSTDFLVAMTGCADYRQIRASYAEADRRLTARLRSADETDDLPQMLTCCDPRQVRVHYRLVSNPRPLPWHLP